MAEVWVTGVDEVGRGALAGPVFAAVVVLKHPIAGLKDSKKCTPKQRQALFELIKNEALDYQVGQASVSEINQWNILKATLLAMKRAVMALEVLPQHVWVDGNQCPDLPMQVQSMVGGDASIPAISAASIVAKVLRDQYMIQLHDAYPQYGFAQNKGYGSLAHRNAICTHGVTPHHRALFVRRTLSNKISQV